MYNLYDAWAMIILMENNHCLKNFKSTTRLQLSRICVVTQRSPVAPYSHIYEIIVLM